MIRSQLFKSALVCMAIILVSNIARAGINLNIYHHGSDIRGMSNVLGDMHQTDFKVDRTLHRVFLPQGWSISEDGAPFDWDGIFPTDNLRVIRSMRSRSGGITSMLFRSDLIKQTGWELTNKRFAQKILADAQGTYVAGEYSTGIGGDTCYYLIGILPGDHIVRITVYRRLDVIYGLLSVASNLDEYTANEAYIAAVHMTYDNSDDDRITAANSVHTFELTPDMKLSIPTNISASVSVFEPRARRKYYNLTAVMPAEQGMAGIIVYSFPDGDAFFEEVFGETRNAFTTTLTRQVADRIGATSGYTFQTGDGVLNMPREIGDRLEVAKFIFTGASFSSRRGESEHIPAIFEMTRIRRNNDCFFVFSVMPTGDQWHTFHQSLAESVIMQLTGGTL